MKERPIIFGAESVKAILAGAKTQTRRVVKPQSIFEGKDVIVRRFPNQQGCPHGKPGEHLWVREAAWAIHDGLTLKMSEAERAEYVRAQGSNGIAFCADYAEPYSPDYWRKV